MRFPFSTLSVRAVATLGVLGGAFLAAIESTIVATAMPTVVEHLGGLDHYSWVFTAYILTSTVTIPLWGRLSDLYGRRRFYMAAVGAFLLGSMLSGVSGSMGQLVLFRAVQGIGAGGLLPLGMTIIADLYTLEERPRAQSLFSIVWGVASIAGPLAGGFITDHFSWRWVFYLNLPFGIAAASLVWHALRDQERHRQHALDVRGALVLTAAITLVLLALEGLGAMDRFLPTGWLVASAVASAALMVWFVRIERAAPEPILPLDLFGNRHVATATLTGFLTGTAMFGLLSYVPLFVQSALGRSATDAGMTLTPVLLGWVTMSLVTARVLPRVGARPLVMTGLTCLTLGFVGLLQISRGSPMWVLRADLGLMGVGMGMTMLSLLLVQQNAVTVDRLGTATSLGQFSRSIGGAFGVALMGSVMGLSMAQATGLPEALALERGLRHAFAAGAFVALAALVSSWLMPAAFPRTPRASNESARPEKDARDRMISTR